VSRRPRQHQGRAGGGSRLNEEHETRFERLVLLGRDHLRKVPRDEAQRGVEQQRCREAISRREERHDRLRRDRGH